MADKSKIRTRAISLFWRLVDSFPIAMPAAVAAFGAVSIALLLLGWLRDWLVWPVGVAAALAAYYVVAKNLRFSAEGSQREQRLAGVAILVGALLWVGVNAHYSSQNVFIYRDPGIYTVTGEWIKNHDNLVIHTPTVFENTPGVQTDSAGFGGIAAKPRQVYAQAPHLLGVLLGLAGRVGGDRLLLHANVIIGGLALIALFGAARMFVRPRWALVGVSVIAVSLPMLVFSRDTYSEPLTMLLVFGALSLVTLLQRQAAGRGLWFIAGLTAGAGVLTRVDAYLFVASLLIFLIVYLALIERPRRYRALLLSGWFLLGMTLPVVLGWLDVTRLSARYYQDLREEIISQLLLVIVLLVVGSVAVAVSWRTSLLKRLDMATKGWRVRAVVGVLCLMALVLVSRPLWYVGHGAVRNGLVAGLQAASGVTPDGTRTYAELTVNWIVWYVGPLVVLLGFFGMLIAVKRIFRSANSFYLLPLLLVVGIQMLLYLNVPNISPDQVWAARRFLPVVFPGMALLAVIAMERLSAMKLFLGRYGSAMMLLLVELMIAGSLFVSFPFLRIRTLATELSQINAVCDALPNNAAALLVGTNAFNMTQAVSTFCGVPVGRVTSPSFSVLRSSAQKAVASGYVPYIVATSDNISALPEGVQLTPVSTVAFAEIEEALYTPPRHAVVVSRTIMLGRLCVAEKVLVCKETSQ